MEEAGNDYVCAALHKNLAQEIAAVGERGDARGFNRTASRFFAKLKFFFSIGA